MLYSLTLIQYNCLNMKERLKTRLERIGFQHGHAHIKSYGTVNYALPNRDIKVNRLPEKVYKSRLSGSGGTLCIKNVYGAGSEMKILRPKPAPQTVTDKNLENNIDDAELDTNRIYNLRKLHDLWNTSTS